MKKVLITGANKGVGFETAKQMLQNGYYVFIGSRTIENGRDAVEKLKAEGFENAEAIQLDVTDSGSVNSAREIIGTMPGSTADGLSLHLTLRSTSLNRYLIPMSTVRCG
jgi:NAD(P)-dependent dehydrogenase (short-subunit alcohol dehydrogenase family)